MADLLEAAKRIERGAGVGVRYVRLLVGAVSDLAVVTGRTLLGRVEPFDEEPWYWDL